MFGLLVGAFLSLGNGISVDRVKKALGDRRIWILGVALVLMGFALLLTATRASQAALIVACIVISALSLGRKAVIALILLSIPLAIGGALFLQKARNTTFVDQSDNSTTWRQTVYREGLELWTDSPRNFVFGVGMDSIQRYAGKWKLFDEGRLPMGHFHSNAIQLVVERGLAALLIYLWLFLGFFRILFERLRQGNFAGWWEHGTLLGTFGAMIGFQLSGLVHYNFGDSEVVMVLFILMGLSSVIIGYSGREEEKV